MQYREKMGKCSVNAVYEKMGKCSVNAVYEKNGKNVIKMQEKR